MKDVIKNIPEIIIKQSENWVRDFIVAHNICPFAGQPLKQNNIHYKVFQGDDLERALVEFIQLCEHLDEEKRIGTALFIFADSLKDFNCYLDILDVANSLLEQQGYEGVYQIASFHPDYCFDGIADGDASHFTNRSPYPMFHIISEQSLEEALKNFPHPEKIPQRNIEYCRRLGSKKLAQILTACFK